MVNSLVDPKTVPITATAEELEKISRMFETWHTEIHRDERQKTINRLKSQLKYLVGSIPGGVFGVLIERFSN